MINYGTWTYIASLPHQLEGFGGQALDNKALMIGNLYQDTLSSFMQTPSMTRPYNIHILFPGGYNRDRYKDEDKILQYNEITGWSEVANMDKPRSRFGVSTLKVDNLFSLCKASHFVALAPTTSNTKYLDI